MQQWGFLYPLMLGVIPLAVGGLVYAYLRRGSAQQKLVSSILILKLLPRQPKFRKTFKPPPRFYFELFLLLLLLIGAAGLYLRGTSAKVIVVLDSSMSTAAQLGNDSVFDELRQRAIHYIDGLSSSTEIAVVQPGEGEPITFVSASTAHTALQSSQVRHIEDALEQVVSRAYAVPAVDAVSVFTDRESPSQIPNTLRWQALSLRSQGVKRDNIAISDISLQQAVAGRTSLQVRIRSFAEQSAEVRVVAEVVRNLKEVWRPVLLRTVDVEFKPSEERVVSIALPADNAGLAYRVRIEPIWQGGATGDALPLDNEAWVAAQSVGTRVAVVSPRSLTELGLDSLSLFEFEATTLKQLQSISPLQGSSPFGLAIVDRSSLDFVPSIPTLLSLSSMPDLAISTEPRSGDMSEWNEGHEVLAYLQFAALKKPQLLPLRPPLWMEPLVQTTAGIVLAAGTRSDARYLGIGIDMFPYRGARDPFLSVLLLNSLKWLARTKLTQGYRSLQRPLLLREPAHRVEIASGEVQQAVPGTPITLPARPGPFIIYPEEGDHGAKVIAINFFSSRESDLISPDTVTLPTVAQTTERESSQSNVAGWLAVLAFLALVLDILRAMVVSKRQYSAMQT